MTKDTPQRFPPHEVSSPAQLARVREEFSDWLSGRANDSDRLNEVLVVLSELGSNAVEATPPEGPPPELRAWMVPDGCTIEVINRVTGEGPDASAWDLDDPLRTGGRGLLLVSALSDDVNIEVDGDVLTVRCTAGLPLDDHASGSTL